MLNRIEREKFPAIMFLLLALTFAAVIEGIGAEELFVIGDGTLGRSVNYTIKVPKESKIGDTIPVVFEFHMDRTEKISYFHFYGTICYDDFDKEYFNISDTALLTESFEHKLDETEFWIELKYDFYTDDGQRFAGWHTHYYDFSSAQISALQSQLNILKVIVVILIIAIGILAIITVNLAKSHGSF
jgi:hypothetical protein